MKKRASARATGALPPPTQSHTCPLIRKPSWTDGAQRTDGRTDGWTVGGQRSCGLVFGTLEVCVCYFAHTKSGARIELSDHEQNLPQGVSRVMQAGFHAPTERGRRHSPVQKRSLRFVSGHPIVKMIAVLKLDK